MYRSLTGFRSLSSYHGVPIRALEGSSNSNILEINPHRLGQPGRKVAPVIYTLDPTKFAEKKQKRLHLGKLKAFKPYISLLKQSSLVNGPHLSVEYDGVTEDTQVHAECPPDTKAFLYYFISSGRPPIAGELRLRVTSSDDAASFESGSDLLLSNGRPWMRPLYSLSKNPGLLPLYEKLREEQLVQDDLDAALSNLPTEHLIYRRSTHLYTMNDTFIVDFSSSKLKFIVITEKGVGKLAFSKMFCDRRQLCQGIRPYAGSALARFERSTLPEHKGSRTVVLRFLKIITPVKCVMSSYDGHICFPKEGELYRSTYGVYGPDIDKTKAASLRDLQLLWDT